MTARHFEAVTIGTSCGGMKALKTLLGALPESYALPLAIVHHIGDRPVDFLVEYLNNHGSIRVKEAEDKEPLIGGCAYLAPPGYHLLIESDRSFSLTVDQRVNYCCPSIDVLFESAAEAYGKSLIGIVLTGANNDGSNGLKYIKQEGGVAIVQNPSTAESKAMPRAAIDAVPPDYVMDLQEIAPLLLKLNPIGDRLIHGTSL